MSFNERERTTHPSYGMIGITRSSSSHKHKFFGSELPVDNYITIAIRQGAMDRELSKDWFHADGRLPLIEINLTPIQFAEMITNLNFGDGMPCTIKYFNGKEVEQVQAPESKTEATHRQFKDRMKSFAKTIVERKDKAKELVKKKTLSKEDQHELNIHLEWLTQELTSNIPFFMECFQEVADKVVAEARSEVEAAITHKIQTLGLTELHNQNKLLKNE